MFQPEEVEELQHRKAEAVGTKPQRYNKHGVVTQSFFRSMCQKLLVLCSDCAYKTQWCFPSICDMVITLESVKNMSLLCQHLYLSKTVLLIINRNKARRRYFWLNCVAS